MRTLLLSLTVVALSLGLVQGACAQAVSASANASATVVANLQIANTLGMDFGTLIVDPAVPGTVVMTPAGLRTSTGGVTLVTGASTPAAATFRVTGQPNAQYVISLPAAAVTIANGGNTMTVSDFTSSPSGTGTLDGGGLQTFAVGATLNVGAAQAVGTYTGTFSVSASYF